MSLLKDIRPKLKGFSLSVQEVLDKQADQISAEIQQGLSRRYKEVIDVSSGDSHRMGIKPITFARQVLAACFYPSLLNDETLPVDVRERAQSILVECEGGSIGSYTATFGIKKIRHSVAEFIARRDGFSSDPENIIITNGSQTALRILLKLFIGNEGSMGTGVLVPVPSYSSFNKALAAQGGIMVSYYLCEEQGWALNLTELRRALSTARRSCNPKILYIINPGNPTGHVQSKALIMEVIHFAAEENLFIMADEVYQGSIYGKGSEFHSYKKVLCEMGAPYSNTVELASFHSISKGVLGECGLRGAYVELVNVDPSIMHHVYKIVCMGSCGCVPGQIALDVMVDPPGPTQPSYALYSQEVHSIRSAIQNNAQRLHKVLNALPGMSCQPVNGGIFAFPRLHLSQSAVTHAEEKQMVPELLYCLRLLEDENVCVAVGCKYGQKDGTYHIRICLAADEELMKDVLQRLKSFHLRFINEFP